MAERRPNEPLAWIFMSHASADLRQVRRVRNYLEDKGAAPLLFHLLGLRLPEEFWPVIEREIEARNFFLLCNSEAAEKSEWVRRERDTVHRLARQRAVRIAEIDVSQPAFDAAALDAFVLKTRVYLSFHGDDWPVVDQLVPALEQAGFSVYELHKHLTPSDDLHATMETEISGTAVAGFFVFLASASSVAVQAFSHELVTAERLGCRIVPLFLDPPAALPAGPIRDIVIRHPGVEAAGDAAAGVRKLVDELLRL